MPPEQTPDPAGPAPERPKAVHRPVMLDEVVDWLAPKEGSVIVDGTAGAGGHTAALARRVGATGRVIGFDRDPGMLDLARAATAGLPVDLVHSPYSEMREGLESVGIRPGTVDGVVLDLGLSSDQLAWRHRGFSFGADGPLDMRFDTTTDQPTAADLLAEMSAEDLANAIYEFGEERLSRRIARKIVETRAADPLTTTAQLADLVRRCYPGKQRHGPIDPATRVFQALRILVNDELRHLDAILDRLPDILAPGGRAAIISFHSLEDRRVKWAFRNDARWTVLTKKLVNATAGETAVNPRARSAKLRVAERWSNQEPIPTPTSPRP